MLIEFKYRKQPYDDSTRGLKKNVKAAAISNRLTVSMLDKRCVSIIKQFKFHTVMHTPINVTASTIQKKIKNKKINLLKLQLNINSN